jgi:hypothetical protein
VSWICRDDKQHDAASPAAIAVATALYLVVKGIAIDAALSLLKSCCFQALTS